MTDIEKEITRLQDPETMRLHMGELTPSELLVAQAAVRYALARAGSERVVSVGELEVLVSQSEDAATLNYNVKVIPSAWITALIAKSGVE